MSGNKLNIQTLMIAVIISVVLSMGISYIISPSTVGPQGPTGPEGIQGPPGRTGDTGYQGETGAQGPRGERGLQGPTGARGPQGEEGLPGESYTYEEFLEYVSVELDTVITFSGSSGRTTNLFYVPTTQIKVSWDLDAFGSYPSFTMSLYRESGFIWEEYWYGLIDEPQGDTYAYISPGYYYLEFSVSSCDYTVTVETVTR